MEGALGVEAATLNRVVEEASWSAQVNSRRLPHASERVFRQLPVGALEPTRWCLSDDMERQRSVSFPGKAPPARKGAGGQHRKPYYPIQRARK